MNEQRHGRECVGQCQPFKSVNFQIRNLILVLIYRLTLSCNTKVKRRQYVGMHCDIHICI